MLHEFATQVTILSQVDQSISGCVEHPRLLAAVGLAPRHFAQVRCWFHECGTAGSCNSVAAFVSDRGIGDRTVLLVPLIGEGRLASAHRALRRCAPGLQRAHHLYTPLVH